MIGLIYKKFAVYFLLMFVMWQASAHDFSGYVLDNSSNPIAFASVEKINSPYKTLTNEFGWFELSHVHTGDTIRISSFGFADFYHLVKNDSAPIRINLKEEVIVLDEISLQSEKDFEDILAQVQLKTNPVKSSQELLTKLPGLFIGQHAGGGKAEQIFLRGFDLDHGTDISISVDNIPVNMVSHAHGQGYADLHFLIPELVKKVQFDKGPYAIDRGNFANAGYINLQTTDKIEKPFAQVEVGQFHTFRSVAGVNLLDKKGKSAYIASEYIYTDGYFDSPQNFNRFNLTGKYANWFNDKTKLTLFGSYFDSRWNASGQIPDRAVEQSLIGFYGAIDNTEGGNTGRTNFSAQLDKYVNSHTYLKNSAYYSAYDFNLFSNFTFFLNDSIYGDQIEQYEKRNLFGAQSELFHEKVLGENSLNFHSGIGFRLDLTDDSQLSHTKNRTEILERHKLGNVNELNSFAFSKANLVTKKWNIGLGARIDNFNFQYTDLLTFEELRKSKNRTRISPKFTAKYTYSPKLQLVFKSGSGFHSNDSRVVLSSSNENILPRAFGNDIGLVWSPKKQWFINFTLWNLYLQDELVYVGDEGIVESSGKTARKGIEFITRYQFAKIFYLSLDANYTHARSRESAEGEAYIPLAPIFSTVGSFSIIHPNGLYGAIKCRYLSDRPANEDFSITAQGYFISDFNFGKEWKKIDLSVRIENLFNTRWKETQFATETRLKNETESVEEIHFTPGTPFSSRLVFKYKF